MLLARPASFGPSLGFSYSKGDNFCLVYEKLLPLIRHLNEEYTIFIELYFFFCIASFLNKLSYCN